MEHGYLRRQPARRALVRRRGRYELLGSHGPPVQMSLSELERRLVSRHFSSDFWAVVQEADRAFEEGDTSWIEFPTGRRLPTAAGEP